MNAIFTNAPKIYASATEKIVKHIIDAVNSIGEFPLSAPRPVRAALWLIFAVCAAFILFPDSWSYPQDTSLAFQLSSNGRALLYALPPVNKSSMPLFSVASLLAGNTTWPEVQSLWTLLSLLICVSGYSLGCLLSGRAAGVAAAASLFAGQRYMFDLEQRFYCLMLTLVANTFAVTLYSRPVRRIIEGCAIGASFLARSVLCWLPPALAALDLFALNGSGEKRSLRAAALSLTIPFLFLVPWMTLKQPPNNKANIFDGRAEWNMVTGAMGKVSTFEGDYRELAGISDGENATLWAAKRMLLNPLSYASGVIKRSWFFLSLHPVSLPLWLAFAVLLRKNPAFRRVNILGAYFLALNLAFSSENRYLVSVVPLLSAISASAIFTLGSKYQAAQKEGFAWFSAAAFLPALLTAFCVVLLLRYPGPKTGYKRLAAAERAIAGHPEVSWLLWQYGKMKLITGDYPAAYDSIGKAAILSPHDLMVKADLMIAAFLKNRRRGRPTAGFDLVRKVPPGEYSFNNFMMARTYILRALLALDMGREKQAAEDLRLAQAECVKGIFFKLRADSADEERLRALDTTLLSRYLPAFLLSFPPELQKKLCGGFVALYSANGLRPPPPESYCAKILEASRSLKENYSDPQAKDPDASWTLPLKASPEKKAEGLGRYFNKSRSYPAVLLERCLALSGRDNKAQALQACQAAAYEAASGTGTDQRDFAIPGCDASFESYKLLKALGRHAEAEETLFWTVNSAPASWSKLAKAKKLLEGDGSK